MFRSTASVMASSCKRVPIPKNGVDYRGKVVLAPMVRSGELPSRLLALKYGADLVWGPETVDKSMIGTTRKFNQDTSTIDFTRFSNNQKGLPEGGKESLIYRLHPEKEKGKLIFQIGTANPKTAVEAAKLVAEDVAGIDVNSGCPKPFSTSGGMGAALLRTPDLLASILTALVEEVGKVYEIGISVKIRILPDAEETRALVTKIVKTGIVGLTVHCRTPSMRPRERAIRDQLVMIREICHEAGIACLINGDVANRDEAVKLAEEFGVDGAMIATAAESNSSVFRSQADGGPLHWREVVPEYFKTAIEVENRWGNTKFLLAQLLPGKVAEAQACQQAKNYTSVCEILKLDSLYDQCRELDEKLGMNDRKPSAKEKAKKNASAQASGKSSTISTIKAKKQHTEDHAPLSQRGITLPAMAAGV